MKENHLAIKLSILLLLLISSGSYIQQAHSSNSANEQIALLSDVDQSRFSQTSERLCHQLNTDVGQNIDLDLSDSESTKKPSGQHKFHKSSKVLILGGSGAFPI